MIPLESFRKYKMLDFLSIFALAVIWKFLSMGINYFASEYWAFVFALFSGAVLLAFTALLIRKIGAPTLFYLIGSLLVVLPGFEVLGLKRIVVFVVAGLLFGAFYKLINFEIKNIPIDLIISSAISAASIPATSTLLLSSGYALSLPLVLINLVLLSAIVGVLGALFAYALWLEVKLTRWVEKFELS